MMRRKLVALAVLLLAGPVWIPSRSADYSQGQMVSVEGVFTWNDKGGVIHWTHRDPGSRHPAGYIDWKGRRYQ